MWGQESQLNPRAPRYHGKVVILVNEDTQSAAELMSMAFRAAGALVIGSTTAGADGIMSWFDLPGGEWAMITGCGWFYPDGRPTQRIGIVPDIVVTPTREGILAGRDEVLERALREILGPDVPESEIRKLAARPTGE
jgi:C-terminal processing protease CtpA/Prc